MAGEVEVFDASDVGDAYGSLDGAVDACVDMPEGGMVGGESFFYGFVVDGADAADIE